MGKRQFDDVISGLSRETTWRSLPRLLLQGLRVDCARAPPWRAASPSQPGLVGGAVLEEQCGQNMAGDQPVTEGEPHGADARAHVQVSV